MSNQKNTSSIIIRSIALNKSLLKSIEKRLVRFSKYYDIPYYYEILFLDQDNIEVNISDKKYTNYNIAFEDLFTKATDKTNKFIVISFEIKDIEGEHTDIGTVLNLNNLCQKFLNEIGINPLYSKNQIQNDNKSLICNNCKWTGNGNELSSVEDDSFEIKQCCPICNEESLIVRKDCPKNIKLS